MGEAYLKTGGSEERDERGRTGYYNT